MFFLLITIIILWLISAVLDFGALCYIWQLEEYRWDRFRVFVRTEQGKKFFKGYLLLWRPIALLIIFYYSLYDYFNVKWLVFAVLLFELLRYGFKLYRRQLKFSTRTAKSFLIIILAILIEGGLLLWLKQWPFVFLMMILRFLIITLLVSLLILPTKLAKRFYIKKAIKKLEQYPNLKVIGITGSYGKTTVKYFLSQILEKKFKVIKTPKNINTDIGIAKFILKNDFNGIDVFVVEMAAYKIGEIKTICEMVRPKIGILTAISEQHLALFGSLKKTQSAKYELLRSLPTDGLAIVNSDNEYCRQYLNELKCQVITFGGEQIYKPDLLVDEQLRALAIGGKHNAMNFAPCILAAEYLGINREEIMAEVKNLKLPEQTLQIRQYGQSIVIDDSYNANPAGFKAALKVLAGYADYEKIVITRGMLELGKRSDELHQEIGREIAAMADKLILITPDFRKPLARGIEKKIEILEKYKSTELLAYFKELKNKKAAILLENRVPANIIKEL